MMSAAHISKAIGHDKIEVNYIYSELLSTDYYKKNPFPHIEINSKDRETIKKEFLLGVEFEDQKKNYELGEKFPEKYKHVGERSKRLYQELLNKYANN